MLCGEVNCPIPAPGETVKPVVKGNLYPTLPEQQG